MVIFYTIVLSVLTVTCYFYTTVLSVLTLEGLVVVFMLSCSTYILFCHLRYAAVRSLDRQSVINLSSVHSALFGVQLCRVWQVCIFGAVNTVHSSATHKASSVDVWSLCLCPRSTACLCWSVTLRANLSCCSTRVVADRLYSRRSCVSETSQG